MADKIKFLEALKMQPLTEEEKTKRKILGRLAGPIATCTESTRNGRLYNRQLWESALADDVFREKVANKSLFLELGHPADREETDMTKICACIPEVPQIIDNDLYAYVDILDTPNGKILKTLCDYGFTPGISSRGSGDVLANNEVDPETFFLETWDIVQLPAVKKARLAVCESLDSSNIKLKKALTESLNEATEEDKLVMKKTLEDLNIKLDDENKEVEECVNTEPVTEAATLEAGTPKNPADIPSLEEDDNTLTEAADEEEAAEEEETTEDAETEDEEPVTADEVDTFEDGVDDGDFTVGTFMKEFEQLSPESPVELELTKVDDEFRVSISAVDPNDDTLFCKFGCTFDVKEVEEEAEANKDTSEEEAEEDEVAETEEAADDGADEEVMESLKQAIRENAELKKEIASLKSGKTVGDTKVTELTEQVEKYKSAFERMSAVAANGAKFQKEVRTLKESLRAKNAKIAELTEQVSKANTLTESTDTTKAKINSLNESLVKAQTRIEESEKKLQEQVEQTKKTVAIAKKYKAKYLESVDAYVASKAKMLGVKSSDIKSQLSEGFTPVDVDVVCDKMLTESVGLSRLPFGSTRGKIAIKEASVPKKAAKFGEGYEIDDSLLELAGLK